MSVRLAVAFLVVGALAQRPVAAQPQPKPPQPELQVIKTVGTPGESAQIQGIVSKLKARFADATYAQQVEVAMSRRDYKAAATLISTAAQVKVDQGPC